MSKLIIFVCNGNIERSVIAAAFLKKIILEQELSTKYSVDSYGLQGTQNTELPKHKNLSEYPNQWAAAKHILKKLECNITTHRAQTITPEVVASASAIIAMDELTYSEAKNSLLTLFPHEKNKIHCFEELTDHRVNINDLADNSSRSQHEAMIITIHKTLIQNHDRIFTWADKIQ